MQTRDHEPDKKPAAWVIRGGPLVAVMALATYVAVYAQWPTLRMQVDLMVYRFAGQRLVQGLDLYSTGLTGKPGELLFIYPPFAAICAVPLTLLRDADVRWLWLFAMLAALTYAVVQMLKSMGVRSGDALLGLGALLVGLIAWLEPLRLTAELGQINLVLLVLVVADLLAARRGKWSGVGIGLAAGLKLTPALFIIYLLVTRRIRAALVSTATFVATVALGFAIAPTDSVAYWLRGRFDDVNRISHDPLANTSVSGLVLRLHGSPATATVVAMVVAAVAVGLAAMACRRGQEVLAIAVVGLASAAASPFSWSHHWVWFAPLIVHLGYRAYVVGSRASAVAMWSLCAGLGGWFVTVAGDTPQAGILSLHLGGVWAEILPATYVFVFAAVLLGTAVWLWRLPDEYLRSPTAHDLEHLESVDAGGN
ncbi:glycosyltransferase 87 family protein [Mycobacterium sp. NPDC048908]|uniref:glycosyltransferase 87 family protein n=1 Tax=Mycobacterium sp. NPDC048908 TaxID=3364292 RepID=UPI003715B32D